MGKLDDLCHLDSNVPQTSQRDGSELRLDVIGDGVVLVSTDFLYLIPQVLDHRL